MLSNSEVIKLFLVNGTIDGIVSIDVANWSGKAIKVPRTEVKDFSLSDELSQAGVYFLMCEEEGEKSVYIGEAADVKERLQQHIYAYTKDKEKFYWNEAVAFVSSKLNKTLIQYMEHCLVSDAKKCCAFNVLTKATFSPEKFKVSLSDQAICQQFMDKIKVLLKLLDYRVYVSAPKISADTQKYICYKSTGFISESGFTILAGSEVKTKVVPSFSTHPYYKLRKELEDTKVIENGIFTRNYEFKSPSAAASIVLGKSSNGKIDWVTELGVALKDTLV